MCNTRNSNAILITKQPSLLLKLNAKEELHHYVDAHDVFEKGPISPRGRPTRPQGPITQFVQPLTLSRTHALTHPLTLSRTHALTHSFARSIIRSLDHRRGLVMKARSGSWHGRVGHEVVRGQAGWALYKYLFTTSRIP